MRSLIEFIRDSQKNKTAIGHFNVSDEATLKAIFTAAQEASKLAGRKIPIIIGVSEGERDFVGGHTIPMRVKFMREFNDYPIFSNADHTKNIELAKQTVDQGFDAVLFDAGDLDLEENIQKTREVVSYIKERAPHMLVEAELGYIGSGSEVLDSLPKGAALTEDAITKPEEAVRFAKETGIDLLAPAVGNVHGMLKNSENPHLFADRIREISEATNLPLVLHGGSGTPDEDFVKAIEAGVAIVHISTELRRAWRVGMERGLKEMPNEVAPYKLLAPAVEEVKKVVLARLRLFNRL